MAKATIKSKSGAVITIEGTTDEVSAMLATFEQETSPARSRRSPARKHEGARDRGEKKRLGAADLVIALKGEGFFEKPKGISQVADALQEQGYLYPITSLSGVLLGLVQKRELRRKKHDGKWVYGK